MKNYKRGRFARRILLVIVILIGVVYLNRVSILQRIVAIGSYSQLINIDKQSSSPTQNDELVNLKYAGQIVVKINHNQPTFSQEDLQIKQGGW
ncbi:hypothetical protein [Leuconostoc mesenteroides]|uniref:hypothetical protein n=1 Tax=Leuconostoc mesenteroides TaxID=1245 RepID=UPI001F5D275C|nr:hypothetical protein [Leuconostoc mesenteroides]UVV91865.1 hypothetical protein NX809_06045 [Leuconostoc mesenteroides]